ncbi:cytochrome b561/ferric reductase transmembrane [Lasiosphaeria hispida]|uniref:Cytochrome b561/ferric reductase transmembrane n=1 Tax=Lasiosphaeria hispida TaxID=260671 RepID=A0AAJ0HLN7_9PEZI|nr:cytochrome b561/ferric reductase transmembrane [Lasiosphaeria hispida]
MAPAPDTLAPAGSSSYSSDTLNVGDGTWDFTKNTFLLPNLVGLNFDTMRYNGMGNRFSTLTQYHSLILGHGILAAITFLFIIPIAVLIVRFYGRSPGAAIRYHAYLQVLAVGFTTVIFILGFIAVGPPRNLTNPHHGIGVAIYVIILLQAFGGRLVRHITGHSLRVHLHRWSGRVVTLLGIAQVPLGLTLYGSPKYLFILFAVWMGFLVLLYFILDYRDQGRHGREHYVSGGRAPETPKQKSNKKWWGLAGLGTLALMRKRKHDKDPERGARSRTPSPARSHRARDGPPEVIPSPRHSESFYDEKQDRRATKEGGGGGGGGGFFNKLLLAGAAGGLAGKFMSRRKSGHGDEYSAVDTDTPSRHHRSRRSAPTDLTSDYTDLTEETETHLHVGRHDGRRDRRSPLLPPPGDPTIVAQALSAAEERPATRPARPVTPRQSHAGRSRFESVEGSDYSSYVSPSRRTSARRKSSGSGGVGKGLLAGIGLGWLAKKATDRRGGRGEEDRLRDEDDRRREEEDERRSSHRTSRYTGDGYPTPTRDSRRRPTRPRPPPAPSAVTMTASVISESSIEPRGNTPYEPAPVGLGVSRPPIAGPSTITPVPPVGGGPVPVPVPVPVSGRTPQGSRYNVGEGVAMPPMPVDPHGIFHPESGSETYFSSGGRPHRRHSNSGRQRRDAEAAAAAAAASASILAAEQEEDRRRRDQRRGGDTPSTSKPVSVKVKVHDDRDRLTFRRLTEEESASEQNRARRRNDSASSHSEVDTPTGRRYRRERDISKQRRAETAAEQQVENDPLLPTGQMPPLPLPPLSPPNPAFAQGRRPQGKDSAYYSGQPQDSGAGPSGTNPAAGTTMSELDNSGGDYSGISPAPSGPGGRDPGASGASAADRRRRRRLERRGGSGVTGTVDYD